MASFFNTPRGRRRARAANTQSLRRWKLADLDGKPVSLADFKGKVVILDFWATWCAPCRDEIPGFVELQKKFADKGHVVVGISLDQEGAALVQKFVKQHGVTYPVVLGNQEVAAAYDGIDALPTTFIIDREGKVAKGHPASRSRRGLKPTLRRCSERGSPRFVCAHGERL